MSNEPPNPASKPPVHTPQQPLSYQTPPPGASIWTHNRWWMILLRMGAGGIAAVICIAAGSFLAGMTNFPPMFFAPGMVVFTALVLLAIRFRRFGYLSGFILAPFLITAALVVLLFAICGMHGFK